MNMKKINKTETEEPKTKPATKPKRETPRPEPRRENDPWTIPAPKVNPTPKAEMKDVKVILKTKADFNLFRNTLGKKEFFDRFDVDMKLVAKLAAADAVKNAALEINFN